MAHYDSRIGVLQAGLSLVNPAGGARVLFAQMDSYSGAWTIAMFEAFLKKMVVNFRRIAKAAKYDVTEDDLRQDAWIIAWELGEERGREVNFSDPLDQKTVMRRVNFRNVARGDWHLRKAARIDLSPADGDAAPAWADRLVAQPSADPIVALLLRESAQQSAQRIEAMMVDSYSQVIAYLMTFSNLKNNRKRICAYLAISSGTLNRRIASAATVFHAQPSLFDGLERICQNFMPLRGSPCAVGRKRHCAGIQAEWEFNQ